MLELKPTYFQNLLKRRLTLGYLVKTQITEPQHKPTKSGFSEEYDHMFL